MQRPSLPVSEDMRFQERSWIAERIGWCLLAIFVALAFLGVFSNGILSSARAQRDGVPMTVDYERFQRKTALTHFAIHLPRQNQDEIWLQFNRALQETYEIESIQPQPARASTTASGVGLFFEAYDGEDLMVMIWARPRQFGLVKLEVTRVPQTLPISILIYP